MGSGGVGEVLDEVDEEVVCPLVSLIPEVEGSVATVGLQVPEPPFTRDGAVVGFLRKRLTLVCNQAVSNSGDATASTPQRQPKNVERSVATTATGLSLESQTAAV